VTSASDPAALSLSGHYIQIDDMAKAVLEDREPMVPGEEARKAVDLILAIYESSKTGKEIILG
jgi:predicted dehydrogenase